MVIEELLRAAEDGLFTPREAKVLESLSLDADTLIYPDLYAIIRMDGDCPEDAQLTLSALKRRRHQRVGVVISQINKKLKSAQLPFAIPIGHARDSYRLVRR